MKREKLNLLFARWYQSQSHRNLPSRYIEREYRREKRRERERKRREKEGESGRDKER